MVTMKKFDHKFIFTIFFIFFIFITGIATLISNPIKIGGGLARGYIDSDNSDNVFQKIGNGFAELEDRVNTYYALHDQSVNTYGAIQKLIDSSLVFDIDKSSTVVKLKNGYLTFKSNTDDTSSLSDYLVSLKKKHKDTDFLYVNKISKNTYDKEILPDYYPYIYKTDIEKTMVNLKQNGVSVLDINNIIKTENIDKYPLFFKTDHHWKPMTGLWVSKLISQSLNDNFNYQFNTDIFNSENYNIETYENAFLGSQGKRVGIFYAGIDDFYIVKPKFPTELSVLASDAETPLIGDFEKTMLHREHLTPNNLFNLDETAYDVYMNGNHSLVNIKNNNGNGKKALLIIDSYGMVVAPYLSLAFSELDCIDIRSYTDSVDKYISDTEPDIVIYMITSHQ